MDHDQTLLSFQETADWIAGLQEVEEEIWSKPLAVDKWSMREVLAHLMFWDQYLLSDVLPRIESEDMVTLPPFDAYNQKAAEYARSKTSKAELIQQAIETRDLLVYRLLELPTSLRVKHVRVNGAAHCPRSQEPYTLFYLVHEFLEHDLHHKQQIDDFLANVRQTAAQKGKK